MSCERNAFKARAFQNMYIVPQHLESAARPCGGFAPGVGIIPLLGRTLLEIRGHRKATATVSFPFQSENGCTFLQEDNPTKT